MAHDPSQPSEETISQTLRDVVKHRFTTGDHDHLTLKLVRDAAQEKLSLPDDFFKEDEKWKKRSKQIVNEYVAQLDAEAEEQKDGAGDDVSQASPVKNDERQEQMSVSPEVSPKKAAKRKSPAESPAKPRKRVKQAVESEPDEGDSTQPQDDRAEEEAEQRQAQDQKKTPTTGQKDDTDSELSSLIDEAPQPKAKRKKKAAPNTDSKPTKGKTPSKKSGGPSDKTSQQEEIKRLQSWLIKCGIRKLWGKELSKFDSDKGKIQHLKGMLADAGMMGRFSEEKARQIKEEREFKADLEAIQEGNKHWGQGLEEDDAESERPKRKRVAKGLPQLPDFGDEED